MTSTANRHNDDEFMAIAGSPDFPDHAREIYIMLDCFGAMSIKKLARLFTLSVDEVEKQLQVMLEAGHIVPTVKRGQKAYKTAATFVEAVGVEAGGLAAA